MMGYVHEVAFTLDGAQFWGGVLVLLAAATVVAGIAEAWRRWFRR